MSNGRYKYHLFIPHIPFQQLHELIFLSPSITLLDIFQHLDCVIAEMSRNHKHLGIVHKDIHARNIFIDSKEMKAYFCDYGLGKETNDSNELLLNNRSFCAHLLDPILRSLPYSSRHTPLRTLVHKAGKVYKVTHSQFHKAKADDAPRIPFLREIREAVQAEIKRCEAEPPVRLMPLARYLESEGRNLPDYPHVYLNWFIEIIAKLTQINYRTGGEYNTYGTKYLFLQIVGSEPKLQWGPGEKIQSTTRRAHISGDDLCDDEPFLGDDIDR